MGFDDNCPKHSDWCANCLIKFVKFLPYHFKHHFMNDSTFVTSIRLDGVTMVKF